MADRARSRGPSGAGRRRRRAGSAPAQLHALAAAGIDAVGLLDAVDVAEEARDRREAALWPYREAVVVAAGDLDAAAAALRGMPGSMIVPAGGDAARPEGGRPPSARRAVRAAARARSSPRSTARRPAGAAVSGVPRAPRRVVIVGGFAEPVTGRVARWRRRGRRWRRQGALARAVRRRRRRRRRRAGRTAARGRARGGRAGRASRRRMAGLRERLERPRSEPRPALGRGGRGRARSALQAEGGHRARWNGPAARPAARRTSASGTRVRAQAAELAAERAALRLATLAADWGGPARERPANGCGAARGRATRTPDEWWRVAERHLDQALRDTSRRRTTRMPEELRFLLRERGGEPARRGAGDVRGACAGRWRPTCAAQEEYEKHQRRQIEAQVVSAAA